MPRRGPPLTTADAQNPPAHLKYLQRTQSNHGTPLPPHNGGSGMEIPPLMIHGSDREGGSGVHQVGEEMFWESSPNINVNRAAPFERVRVPPPPPAPITPRIRAPAKWPGETVGQCHAVTGGGRGPRCSKPASGGLYCGQHSSMQSQYIGYLFLV
ncbi:hypothetical protein SISSUDRAFT_523696 [Sistotremastrum suecicum HHB10207 ss-3]|uniref:Uncharacterized protein n=1 Tax=Sistotremastrum suecicum HHB10207 ss-3 TaxID=1314776 RepID=A0A165XW45_9AGAM|nr:hypothetical protein SISSUDRAFT_523696 [Sistotremastrum suecicum HHB10207 ss-3]